VPESSKSLQPGESLEAARPAPVSWTATGYRLLIDGLARRVVTLGGITIIASILAILLVIVSEVYPLFTPAKVTPLPATQAVTAGPVLAFGTDEYRETGYLVTPDGLQFVRLRDGMRLPDAAGPTLGKAKVTATSPLGRGPFILGLSDGRAIPMEVKFTTAHQDGMRTIAPVLSPGDPFTVDPEGRPIRQIAFAGPKSGPITAATVDSRDLILVTVQETKPLIGPPVKEESRQTLRLPVEGEITALALDGRGEDLFVATNVGLLLRVDLRDPDTPKVSPPVQATSRPGVSITSLGLLLGDRTLIVGDASGGVSAWRPLQLEGGDLRMHQIHGFAAHAGPVVAIEPSRRDKGFLTADASGEARLHFGTSGETLLSLKAESGRILAGAFAPRADGLLLADASGRLFQWTLDNPHPETTLRTLFGKVWYEGYRGPTYVWQSSGASDEFEPKLSLVPLIYGTLKGTFYALLVAVPIALLAALYASQFMHPTLKGVVKPTVEIMAAMPSVVLGFLAGLWLAPQIERAVPALFLMPLVIPLLILASVCAWRFVPIGFRQHIKPGAELALLVPIMLLGAYVAFALGGLVEHTWLAGDYRGWFLRALGLNYDQRNSLVVGIAMGFAVIPIIFTIAEDSLSNVPQHLVAGSLALGATRWQTALRVVLPTASPGIFSAIMIGFGRAVGETMIVLMATGNTPVMNWNIFSGFRALSANIAVELPEAPVGGTLFRVLFLAALLLFAMTFVVNTAAEVVRLRLRRKYRFL
jgi:phosphate transport system permease protein